MCVYVGNTGRHAVGERVYGMYTYSWRAVRNLCAPRVTRHCTTAPRSGTEHTKSTLYPQKWQKMYTLYGTSTIDDDLPHICTARVNGKLFSGFFFSWRRADYTCIGGWSSNVISVCVCQNAVGFIILIIDGQTDEIAAVSAMQVASLLVSLAIRVLLYSIPLTK